MSPCNHLNEAVFCPFYERANHVRQYLLQVVNILCAGQAPAEVIPQLCGATLFLCKKSDGLHPIAVDEVLRHLTSKCVARQVQPEAARILSPLQVGFGIPLGCEAVVHSAASLQNSSTLVTVGRYILFMDFSNLSVGRSCFRG